MTQRTVYPKTYPGELYDTALQAARIAARLTQNELAQKAGVGRATVASMETRPNRRFRLLHCSRVAGALGLELADLFTADPPPAEV